MQTPLTDRVFVYGSLRREQHNHGWLGGARYLGDWRTEASFNLYDLGAYPAVTRAGDTVIQGEVYAIDTIILKRLDQLEGYPEFYDRTRLATRWGEAWIYLLAPQYCQDAERVPDGDWVKWLECRSLALGGRVRA